ncbi:MAG TPA: S41 family peptidase [Vitreimonas sp.]|nr:S41 family peptidase [Vitreimonas sp.]
MRISRRGFGPLAFAGAAFGASPAAAADAPAWRSSLRHLADVVETVHPNPFTNIARADFERRARELERALPRLSDEQRMARAMQLVAMLGDGHTQLEPITDAFRLWYPIRLYEFSDGYFVTSAYGQDADLAGAEIIEIAGRPVADVANAARSLAGADNPLDAKERLYPLHNAALMRALGFAGADGALAITARLANGQTVSRPLPAQHGSDPVFASGGVFDWRYRSEPFGTPLGQMSDWTSAYRALPASAFRSEDRTRPLHLMLRRARIAHALPAQSAYYMQLNSVGNLPDDPMAEFAERALREVDALRLRALIVDLRYNFGGDGSKVPGFIHAFIRRGQNPPWQNLYVLTGRRTFSAAIMMMAAFVDHAQATFIGEPAGGALDHYGDATAIELTDIGANLYVSTLFHQLQDQGQRYDIMPVDVAAPFSFADWSAGRDPAIDPILAGEEMRSIPLIALAESGAAARRAFDARNQRLPAYRDWMALREFDLIRAIWRLGDLNRRADALELARIMVELRPASARAHSVLGDQLIALDQREQGLAAYREALRLDPNNLDNVSQRAALAEAAH